MVDLDVSWWLWPCGHVALWSWDPVALWPCSALVLASARPEASLGYDFMTFSGFSRLFCPPTLPPGEFRPATLWVCRASSGLSAIKVWVLFCLCRRRYVILSPSPLCPGLTFPDFQDFQDFFAHHPCLLVSFDLKLCVIVGHREDYLPCKFGRYPVYVDGDMRIGSNGFSCCLLACCCCCLLLKYFLALET